ncbi:hypothetical protein FRC08_005240 [Ceratobasidium sp. 394]|nr:hypothetical protein FRC08_005240 [Ceratobasidium sp. 394]
MDSDSLHPRCCTGQFQACNLLVNWALKAAVQQAWRADIVDETLEAVESDIAPTDSKLRGIEAFIGLFKPTRQLIVRIWYKSHEARQALLKMQTSDPDFHAEITLGRSSPVHSQSGEVEAQGSEEESSDYDDDFGLAADISSRWGS